VIAIGNLIDEIQAIVASGTAPEKGRLIELATAYLQLCQLVKDKAVRCRDLLRQGMREEAIALAKEPPALQEAADVLTFDGRAAWVAICEDMGIELRHFDFSPEVVTRVLGDLSTDVESLNRLLAKHRLLALGQAPLAPRILVLRSILRADPARPFWRKDLQALENARLEELARLVPEALATRNRPALEAMREELKSTDWLTSPPKSNLLKVEAALKPFVEEDVRQRQADLGEQLRQAHSALSKDLCRDLLAQLTQVEQETGVAPEPEIAFDMAAVEAWLKEEDEAARREQEFKASCTALEAALDGNAALHALEARAAAVLRHGQGMPRPIATRFDARVNDLRRARRIKTWFIFSAVFAAAAALAVGIYFYTNWRKEVNRRAAYVQELRRLADEGKLGEAQDYVAGLPPEMQGDGRIVAIKGELDAQINSEKGRKSLFHERVAKAQESLERAGKAALRPTLSQTDIGYIEQDLAAAEDGFKKAITVAKSDDEKGTIQAGTERIKSIRGGLAERARKVIDVAFADLRVAFNGAEEAQTKERQAITEAYQKLTDPPPPGSLDGLADACIRKSEQVAKMDGLNVAQRADAERYAADVRKLRDELREKRRNATDAADAFRQIPALYDKPAELAKQLQDFQARFGDHPLAAELGRAAGLADAWRAYQAWHTLSEPWVGDPRVCKPKDAGLRITAIEDHLRLFPASPLKSAAEEYLKYLQAARKALPDDGSIGGMATIKDGLFVNRLMADTYVVKAAKDKRYYTFEPNLDEAKGGEQMAGYWVKWINNETCKVTTLLLRVKAPKDLDGDPNPLPESGQARFVRAVRERLAKYEGAGWETIYLELAEKVKGYTDTDPIVRAKLLKFFVELAKEFAWVQSPTIEDLLRQLGALNLNVRWMDPNDADANLSRPECACFFETTKPLTPLVEDAVKRVRELQGLFRPYRAVGILLSVGGPAEVRLGAREKLDDGDLYILGIRGGPAPAFHPVGTAAAGKVKMADHLRGEFPRGSVVYFVARPTGAAPKK